MNSLRRPSLGSISALVFASVAFRVAPACSGTSGNGTGFSSGGSGGGSGGSGSGADASASSGDSGGSGGKSSGSSSGAIGPSSGSGSGSSSGVRPSSSSSGSSGSSSGQTSSSNSSGGSGSSSSSSGGGSSGGSSGSMAGGTGNLPTMLPTAKGTCPTLATGNSQMIALNGTGMPWSLWVGSKASAPTGPIMIYWHATGTNSQEVVESLGMNGINTITGLGGIVASAESTSSTGTTTGNGVWYTGDMDYADFIIACAIQQLNIDTSHIHAAGYSAGAIQTGYMWYVRSGYLASAIVYSGGAGGFGNMLQDPSNAPSLLGAEGSTGGSAGCSSLTATNCDLLAASTEMFEMTAKSAGAPVVIDCNDGSSHVDITRLTNLSPVAWQFFKDHPFKGPKPDPYASGLPAGFPTICKVL